MYPQPKERGYGKDTGLQGNWLKIADGAAADRLDPGKAWQIQKYESGANKLNTGRLQQLAEALSIPVQSFFKDRSDYLLLAVSEKISWTWTAKNGGYHTKPQRTLRKTRSYFPLLRFSTRVLLLYS
jgi:hypothetical protein